MAQQRNTISIFSAVLAISAVNAECRLIRAKSVGHFECIMQNKANFRKGQMTVSPYNTKVYENICVCRVPKNKPNQSQFVFFSAENAELAELLLLKDLCQCNWIKHNYLPVALFPLTSSTAGDYNEIFCLMSYLQRTPSERVWR
jgi:hypothetical protein